MNLLKPLLGSLNNPGNTESIVKTAESVSDRIDHYYLHGQVKGTTTYIHELDDHLRWRNGFLYAISGFPGAGKSTFLLYLLYLKVLSEKIRVAMYAPEGYPIEDVVEELMRMYCGNNISKGYGDQATPDQYKEAKQFVNNHFYFLEFTSIPSINDVLHEFELLQPDLVVIDPFNSIAEGADMSGGGNISQYLKAALTQCKMFSVQKNIPVCLVEHPRSTGGQSAQDRPEPSPFMIYGGSMWWNKVDVFFTVDRDMFDSKNPAVNIKIWKVKKQRLMGKPGEVQLDFDFKTSRYKASFETPANVF